jgi:hypothetical protein
VGLDERAQRHHLAAVVAHVDLQQVLDLAALVAFGLHHHPLHAALVGKSLT